MATETWLIDGNYRSTLLIRLAAADTVVFLDVGAWRCLIGVLQRRARQHGGQDRGVGVFDRITWSFIKYILGFRRRMAPQVRILIDAHVQPGATVVVLRNRRGVTRFRAAALASKA